MPVLLQLLHFCIYYHVHVAANNTDKLYNVVSRSEYICSHLKEDKCTQQRYAG